MLLISKNQLILLDAVYNEFDTKFVDHDELLNIATLIGCRLKTPELLFTDWQTLLQWKGCQDQSLIPAHEGWVLEDASGFNVKYKTQFYKFWKHMQLVKKSLPKKWHMLKQQNLLEGWLEGL